MITLGIVREWVGLALCIHGMTARWVEGNEQIWQSDVKHHDVLREAQAGWYHWREACATGWQGWTGLEGKARPVPGCLVRHSEVLRPSFSLLCCGGPALSLPFSGLGFHLQDHWAGTQRGPHSEIANSPDKDFMLRDRSRKEMEWVVSKAGKSQEIFPQAKWRKCFKKGVIMSVKRYQELTWDDSSLSPQTCSFPSIHWLNKWHQHLLK